MSDFNVLTSHEVVEKYADLLGSGAIEGVPEDVLPLLEDERVLALLENMVVFLLVNGAVRGIILDEENMGIEPT